MNYVTGRYARVCFCPITQITEFELFSPRVQPPCRSPLGSVKKFKKIELDIKQPGVLIVFMEKRIFLFFFYVDDEIVYIFKLCPTILFCPVFSTNDGQYLSHRNESHPSKFVHDYLMGQKKKNDYGMLINL